MEYGGRADLDAAGGVGVQQGEDRGGRWDVAKPGDCRPGAGPRRQGWTGRQACDVAKKNVADRQGGVRLPAWPDVLAMAMPETWGDCATNIMPS